MDHTQLHIPNNQVNSRELVYRDSLISGKELVWVNVKQQRGLYCNGFSYPRVHILYFGYGAGGGFTQTLKRYNVQRGLTSLHIHAYS